MQEHKINLHRQIAKLEETKDKILRAYLKMGKTEEEFHEKYDKIIYPTLCYDKEGNLIEKE